jgi:hypothetical protein
LRYHDRHDIYTVLPDGTKLSKLDVNDPQAPHEPLEAGHARWAADGSGLSFSLLMNGNPFLAWMDADGSNQALVPGPVVGSFSELQPIEGENG